MSQRKVFAEINALVCDVCDKIIDQDAEGYCTTWIHNMAGVDYSTNTRRIYKPVHMIFSFRRNKDKHSAEEDWAKYDFHSACFDNLMIDFLKKKGGNEHSND